MEFSSCSPVHLISCIYSQLAHLSQLRWVGGFSPSGCICWKTLSRRMLDAFEFHRTTSQSHLIWNPSTFKTQLDGLARFGLVTCNYLQIFQLHPSQRSFSQVISCFPNHRNQTPTLTHQLTSRRDKKKSINRPGVMPKNRPKPGSTNHKTSPTWHVSRGKFPKNPPKLGPWVHPHWTSPARLFLQYATGSLVVWCLCGALRVWVVGWFQGKRPPNRWKTPREKWHGRCGNNCTSRKELYNNMGTKNAFPTACFNLSRSLNLLLDVLIHQAITWWSLQSLH